MTATNDERSIVQKKNTEQGVFRRKLPPDVRDDPREGYVGP